MDPPYSLLCYLRIREVGPHLSHRALWVLLRRRERGLSRSAAQTEWRKTIPYELYFVGNAACPVPSHTWNGAHTALRAREIIPHKTAPTYSTGNLVRKLTCSVFCFCPTSQTHRQPVRQPARRRTRANAYRTHPSELPPQMDQSPWQHAR